MMTLTRRQAGTLKCVFRAALNLSTRGPFPPVMIAGGDDGYQIRCRTADVTAAYCTTDKPLTERILVPFALLAECAANNDQLVSLEQTKDSLIARWQDAAVPQVRRFDSMELPEEEWPGVPEQLAENSPQLLSALNDACEVTDPNSSRYALGCVQLTGGGSIAATDGKQALVQRGYNFPWEGDILVPSSKLFGCKQLTLNDFVQIGSHGQWLTIRVGNWTFQSKHHAGRFPRVDDMLQVADAAVARVEFPRLDREFLRENLWLLPGDKDFNSPCTIDLNGSIAVRAKASDADTVTELILTGSTRIGEAIRFNTNRRFIERAVQLGFDRIHLSSASSPAYCLDEKRHYLWALLEPKDALQPTPDAVQIESSASEPISDSKIPRTPRRQNVKSHQHPNDQKHASATDPSTSRSSTSTTVTTKAVLQESGRELSSIDQAITVRDSLRNVAGEVGELVRTLKREKKQNRAVRSTLLSLRQLQEINA